MPKRVSKFKQYEAVVFDPSWARKKGQLDPRHPLKYGEMVVYFGEMPNVQGHCVVACYDGRVVPMIHPEDLRKAKESEL